MNMANSSILPPAGKSSRGDVETSVGRDRFGRVGGQRAAAGGSDEERVISALLDAPFPANRIKIRVAVSNKNTGMGLVTPYIDRRDVEERLDQVLGKTGWSIESCEHTVCGNSVRTTVTLKACIAGNWISRTGVAGDRQEDAAKSAYTEAFKLAACNLGVGRCIYDLPKPMVQLEKGRSGRDNWFLPRDYRYELPHWWVDGLMGENSGLRGFSDEMKRAYMRVACGGSFAGLREEEGKTQRPESQVEPDPESAEQPVESGGGNEVVEAPQAQVEPAQDAPSEPAPDDECVEEEAAKEEPAGGTAEPPFNDSQTVVELGRGEEPLMLPTADGEPVMLSPVAQRHFERAMHQRKSLRTADGVAAVLDFLRSINEDREKAVVSKREMKVMELAIFREAEKLQQGAR